MPPTPLAARRFRTARAFVPEVRAIGALHYSPAEKRRLRGQRQYPASRFQQPGGDGRQVPPLLARPRP
jgi:hypothetical protein